MTPFAFLFAAAALSAAPYQGDASQAIRWRAYHSGQHSSVDNESTFVMNNQAEFERYWQSAFGKQGTPIPRDVKWGEEMLVAVHLGTRNSGGYSVFVQSIQRTSANTITVRYCERKPASGSANITVLTSPYEIVRMNRAGGNLKFEKTTATGFAIQPSQQMWRVLIEGDSSKITRAEQYVITNAAEWKEYWQRHSPNRTAAPTVDFDRETLIALHLGQRATGGYDLIVTDVVPWPGRGLAVSYVERRPSEGQIVTRMQSQPFSVIRVPKFIGEVTVDGRVWDNGG